MLTPVSVGPMLQLKLCQTLPKTEFSSLPARSSLSGSLAPGYHKDILAPMPKTPNNPMPLQWFTKTPNIKTPHTRKYPNRNPVPLQNASPLQK